MTEVRANSAWKAVERMVNGQLTFFCVVATADSVLRHRGISVRAPIPASAAQATGHSFQSGDGANRCALRKAWVQISIFGCATADQLQWGSQASQGSVGDQKLWLVKSGLSMDADPPIAQINANFQRAQREKGSLLRLVPFVMGLLRLRP
jgi:hypothetical protein